MELEEFIKTVRRGFDEEKIKTTKELTDYDLMVLFAMGKIGERKGYPCDITPEEIYEECRKLGEYAKRLLDEEENGSR